MKQEIFDTVIVGGGVAGLTAAAYLARAKKKVLLIEKNDEFGGLVNSFSHKGFRFDAGVRALEDAGIILPMLKDLGIELEIVKSPVSVGVEDEILDIKDINSLDDYRNMLVRLYPGSEDEIDALLKIIKLVMKRMDVLYGVENPLFKDLKRDREFIFKKLLPWLPKFLLTVGKINKMSMPVEDYLEEIIQNDSLRDIVAQHFFKHTPTFFALSYFSLYLDYFYPKEGVGSIAEALVDKIKELNGRLLPGTTITKVDAAKKIVYDENGTAYSYENLIWAGDLKTLYKITDTYGLQQNTRKEFASKGELYFSKRGAESVYSIFLEIDEPLDTFRNIANGHFFYTPSRKGLRETHTKELDKMLSNWDNVSKEEIYSWAERYTKLNTYEVSIPGLKNSELAPEGKTGMVISFLAEYELFQKLQEKNLYDDFRNDIEDMIIDVLTASVFPMLKAKLMHKFSFTPVSYENRTGSSEGAIVGWTFSEPVPVLNQIQKAGKSIFTPVPTIYKIGQWAYSPAGVPMSILTGKIAADELIKKK
jgi:phytoene dehydrogenase-like protein